MIVHIDIYFNTKVKLISLEKEVNSVDQALEELTSKIIPVIEDKIKACYEFSYRERFRYDLSGNVIDKTNDTIAYNINVTKSHPDYLLTGNEFHELFFYGLRIRLFDVFKNRK